MSSATKFILYLSVLHIALGVVTYFWLQSTPVMILVAEGLLLVSAYVAYRVYRTLIAPVNLLAQGAAALEDQDFSVKLLPTGSFEMDAIVGIYNRMIAQLRTERVTGRQREEFLERILSSADMGVVVLDFDGKVESMNPWMEQRVISDAFRERMLLPVADRAEVRRFPDGHRYVVERSSFIDRGFERDFLIVRDLSSELARAEKEAYGQVIRMMAHEVNNTNAGVVSILESILEAGREGDPGLAELTEDYLPAVITRAKHMTDFIRNFAKVVRLPPPLKKATDLNDLLTRTGEIIGASFASKDIELKYDLAKGSLPLAVDPAQMEQVVINALTNAGQSIGRNGRILISSQENPVAFTISDDGPGISSAAADKLFTPFFSTKPQGQGIGLTLAREILEAHQATYYLRSGEDGWTRFHVVFPA